jgi:hypothetical protein
MEGRGKKILFGCLGGCGVVLVIFVGSCVGFTMWLNSPGEVLEPEVLMGPDTTGYVEWILRLEDPGTAEFTNAMLESLGNIRRRSNSPLPDGLENVVDSLQSKSAQKDIAKLFPVVVAWTARPGALEDEDAHLFTVSARGMGHQMILADWLFGWVIGWNDNVEIVRHRGEKIYLLQKTEGISPAVFVKRGIVFVSTDVDAARLALDRLDSPDVENGAGADLDGLYSGLPKDQALRGALTNRRGEIRRILDQLGLSTDLAGDEVWAAIRGLTVVANFRDEDVFAGAMEIHGPDAAWAEANAEALGAALVSVFDQWDIEFETEVRHIGRRIRVDFSAADLLDHVDRIE